MARRPAHRPTTPDSDPVRWAGGVHVEGTRLWCDAPGRGRGLCFVSASDVELPRQHAGRLLCTERTARLVSSSTEVLITPYRRPFSFGKARLELVPGGRLPGSAQLLIELDGPKLLYAGRTIAAGRRTAEPRQSGAGSVLIVDAPAAVHDEMPSETSELARLVERAQSLAKTRVVVLLTPDGLAAELSSWLGHAGLTVRVHRRWTQPLATLRELGVDVPKVAPWRAVGLVPVGEVVLWPAGVAVPHEAAAVLTVGVVTADADHFVVGDSLDRAGLVALALESEAHTVLLTAGYSSAVADALKAHGITARPLGPPTQMALHLPGAVRE